jgi:hypothetical protein
MSPYGKEQKEYAKVIVKAWMDDAFRARLIANPRQVLEGERTSSSFSLTPER